MQDASDQKWLEHHDLIRWIVHPFYDTSSDNSPWMITSWCALLHDQLEQPICLNYSAFWTEILFGGLLFSRPCGISVIGTFNHNHLLIRLPESTNSRFWVPNLSDNVNGVVNYGGCHLQSRVQNSSPSTKPLNLNTDLVEEILLFFVKTIKHIMHSLQKWVHLTWLNV